MEDSVSGSIATVRGEFEAVSTFNGEALRLYGTSDGNHSQGFMSGYIDLPNGLISSKTNLTVEVWAAPEGDMPYGRVFDFGRCTDAGTHGPGAAPGEIVDINGQGSIPGETSAEDTLYLTFQAADDPDAQRMDAKVDGIDQPGLHHDSALETNEGTLYHYVMTFEDTVDGGVVTWYRDGSEVYSSEVSFHLSELEDVNNWLGRSQWTTDWNANASFSEFRIWDNALTPAEISNNYAAGPDSFTPAPAPEPDHLWTFTTPEDSTAEAETVLLDSIAELPITLKGNGGSLSGRAVVLPGNTNGNQTAATISAYLDLPNGTVSESASVTFEAWATPISSKNWQRLFDFGRCVETYGVGAATGEIIENSGAPGFTDAYDNLSLTFNNGDDLDQQQLEGEYDDNGPQFSFSNAETVAGTEYHYALVVEDGAGVYGESGCQARYYRNSVLQNSEDFAFRMVDMEDVNNWIGRSMYTGDSNSNLALNELRIYRRAITSPEILASYVAGPDPSSGPLEPPAPPQIPVFRWSFNEPAGDVASGTDFLDVVSGEPVSLLGNGASLTGTALRLPGGTDGRETAASISAYLDLANGLISSHPTFTMEAWVTPKSSRNWQRLFDFGNCSVTHGAGASEGEVIDDDEAPPNFSGEDSLILSLNLGDELGNHRLEGKLDNFDDVSVDTNLSGITEVDAEYHFIMTVEDQKGAYGSDGCRVRWYRDGVPQSTADLPFRLNDPAFNDNNNWIGRSNWAADENTDMEINELRFYDRALTIGEVETSYEEAADTVFPAPIANDDVVTIHSGQKVLIDVLSNDEEGAIATTVEIVNAPSSGLAMVESSGEIRYVHDGSDSFPVSFNYRVSGAGGVSELGTVTIELATELRISGMNYNVPLEPPATAIGTVDAFPGVTFNRPVALTSPPGDGERLFVSEIGGVLKVIPDVTSEFPTSEVVLDIPEAISGRSPVETIEGGANQEMGLLGVAFHPDFVNNGYLYASYTVRKDGEEFYQRLSRFTIPTAEIVEPTPAADASSELILIEQLDQGANHQGGDVHFGPDGYLYVAYGDEENPRDFRLNSQRIDKDYFAGMLRIDVDKLPGNLEPNPHPSVPTDSGVARYSVPADNPWVGATSFLGQPVTPSDVITEFFAVGLRSPWRFSFDSETGEIWLGDVGQDRYEEIDLIEKGENYGWVFREGAHDIGSDNDGWPEKPGNFNEIATDPLYEYVHTSMAGEAAFKGNSVTGGLVYRGTNIPSLTGKYVFGDQVSSHVWALERGEDFIEVERVTGLSHVSSFGVDPSNQDVLMTFTPANAANSNTYGIKRLVSETTDSAFPDTLSETGLFADLADLSPQPGLLPYQPNVKFWSDHALKRRWFSIPDDDARMTWAKEGPWSYPNSQLFVKHFDLETTRGDAATAKRLETRLLVRNDSGSYGVSYRWNDAGTEATLVGDGGEAFDVDVEVDGEPRVQTWQIPSRAQCIVCHNPSAGHALSFNTRQLNLEHGINGYVGNQIELLSAAGYLSNEPDPIETLPKHVQYDDVSVTLEERARTYFDVNCAYCHQPGGGGPGWDGRSLLTLEATRMINGDVAEVENDGDKLIVPGDATHSVILSRMEGSNNYTRMPPLATSEDDEEAIALIREWIESELPDHVLYDDWAGSSGHNLVGERGDDDDGDGRTNYEEYLLASDPLSGNDSNSIAVNPGEGTLSFERKPFRIYEIETSTTLDNNWTHWEMLGNMRGYSGEAMMENIPLDAEVDPKRFFRLRVSEP
jgi:uncharacterized repeat protein (TIGR03806 family)